MTAVAAMIFVMFRKGIWYDEVWTLFFARHDVTLGVSYSTRWSYDIHPPLFYFIQWVFEPLVGDAVGPRRLLNLIPVTAAMLAILFIARRRPDLRWALMIATILFIGNPIAFDFIVQARSYAGQISAWFVCCAALLAMMTQDGDYKPDDAWLLYIFIVAVGIALNLHYLCTLVTGTLISAFVVSLWLEGRKRWASRVFISTVVGSALVLVAAVAQYSTVTTITQNFWAQTGFIEALGIIGLGLIMYFALNPGVWAGLASLLNDRAATLAELRASGGFRYAVTSIAGVATAIIVVLILNVFRPVIIRQYFAPLFPTVQVSLAVLIAPAARRRPAVLWLVVAGALFWTLLYGSRRSGVKDWDDTAALIGQQVHMCPTTRVIGVPPWIMHAHAHLFLLRNEWDVVKFGYDQLGVKYGFSPEFQAGTLPVRRLGKACPTIVWTEAYGSTPPSAAFVAKAARLSVSRSELRAATVHQGPTGFAMSFFLQPDGPP